MTKHEIPEFVEILGVDERVHRVPADRADLFRNDSDGSPLDNDQYDETLRRLNADNSHLIPEEFRVAEQEEEPNG